MGAVTCGWAGRCACGMGQKVERRQNKEGYKGAGSGKSGKSGVNERAGEQNKTREGGQV
jgi:hypothetical protein